jgi:hypothetical protein
VAAKSNWGEAASGRDVLVREAPVAVAAVRGRRRRLPSLLDAPAALSWLSETLSMGKLLGRAE